MSGSVTELLEDIEVGYGDAVLAQVQPSHTGIDIVQQDGFHLHLSHCELDQAAVGLGSEQSSIVLYLATVAKRVQMEATQVVDFQESLVWVSTGPWAGEDLDRLLGLTSHQ